MLVRFRGIQTGLQRRRTVIALGGYNVTSTRIKRFAFTNLMHSYIMEFHADSCFDPIIT